jgi:hypothetical protein
MNRMQMDSGRTPETAAPSTGSPGQTARENAGALWHDARDIARNKLGEQQREAASGLGDMAGALRAAAREVEGRQQPTVAKLAQSAADGLERLSGTLRNKDLDGMVRDAESFARRQPLVFFGAAMAAGFLAVRFLKSSSEATQPPPADRADRPMNTLLEE